MVFQNQTVPLQKKPSLVTGTFSRRLIATEIFSAQARLRWVCLVFRDLCVCTHSAHRAQEFRRVSCCVEAFLGMCSWDRHVYRGGSKLEAGAVVPISLSYSSVGQLTPLPSGNALTGDDHPSFMPEGVVCPRPFNELHSSAGDSQEEPTFPPPPYYRPPPPIA